MKKIFLSAFLLITMSALQAGTGWYQDYILINPNNYGSGYYWIGGDPSFGTQLQGLSFGNVSSLEMTGCDMKYWSDSQDRTGGSFFYQIKSADGSIVITGPIEVIWDQTYLGGNDYQGLKIVSVNLLSGLTLNSSYQLHIWAKSWGSNQGDSWLSNGGSNYVATFTYTSATFTGIGDWTESARWNPGLPTSTSNAIISGTATISTAITINDLSISSGNSLKINPTKSLTVNGILSNAGGTSGLVVKSDAGGTGSLKHTSANVDATFERYMNDAEWTDSKDGWHFLSSPVASQAINPNFTGGNYDFYCWYEPDNKWVNFKNTTEPTTWNTANGSNNFTVGKGYMAAYDAADTKIFSGKLNVADVPISGLTISSGANKSWHLLGNPFACSLSWDASGDWSWSNISGVAKIWNELNQSYSDLSSSPASLIPATNGFMVQVETATGSLTLPASKRVHSAQAFYKSTNPFLKLMARNTASGNAQESSVCFIPDATTGFDLMYDSEFLEGYGPSFYSVAGEEHFSTNALPDAGGIVQIPFDFIKNEGDSFSIEAETITDIYGPVILKDLKTGISQDLTVNPVYVFTSAPEDNPSRFLLTFGHVGMDENIKNSPFTVYASGNILVVTDKTGKNQGNILVYNLTGQLIASGKLNGCSAYCLSLNVPSGYYLVKVVSPETTQSSKVFIQ